MAVLSEYLSRNTLLQWIKERTMGEWAKIGLTLAGAAVIAWNMVQKHEYQIVGLEEAFTTHIQKHDEAIREIRTGLDQLHYDIIRLSTRDELRRPMDGSR